MNEEHRLFMYEKLEKLWVQYSHWDLLTVLSFVDPDLAATDTELAAMIDSKLVKNKYTDTMED